MITDAETNFLFLADSLLKRHPTFTKNLTEKLSQFEIDFSVLTNTKDIWAVDFMPIQILENEFVQFDYSPDYLRGFKKWSKTISDVDLICNKINLKRKKSSIRLDGGNVVKANNKVIFCNKIFTENPALSQKKIVEELESIFLTDQLIFIPTQPKDIIGHADGLIRFLNENTVLINKFPKSNFKSDLLKVLSVNKLEAIEIPYNPFENKNNLQANGVYINYLEMENLILLPSFNLKEDEECFSLFEKLFPSKNIAPFDCNEIANQGGVLNCISWNVKKETSTDGICNY
jgi:agmatine deiminase